MDALESADLDRGASSEGDRPAGGRRVRWGPMLWLTAGVLWGIVFFVTASVGLIIIPFVVPLAVFVFILVEAKTEGRAAALVGLFVAVDLFVVSLILDPPCAAPILQQDPEGNFISGCAEAESVAGLALSAGFGNLLVIALAWGLVKRRRTEAAASGDAGLVPQG